MSNEEITATASPRPWRVNGHSIEANDPEGLWLQNEKTGWGVVANLPSCPKSRMSKKNRETWDAIVEANAALIVKAVNEHHDLYAAWLESASGLVKTTSDLYNETKMRVAAEAERDRLRDIVRRLCDELESHYYEPESMDDPCIVREARAAIGEGEKA